MSIDSALKVLKLFSLPQTSKIAVFLISSGSMCEGEELQYHLLKDERFAWSRTEIENERLVETFEMKILPQKPQL